MAVKPQVLRAIAQAQLSNIFPHQEPSVHQELVTSVVRQWTTYDGKAGVFTIPVHYWLNVVPQDGKVLAGVEVVPGTLRQHLGTWGVVVEDLPRVVHDLSVAQAAVFQNAEGLSVRVRANPVEHTFRFEEVSEEDGLEE